MLPLGVMLAHLVEENLQVGLRVLSEKGLELAVDYLEVVTGVDKLLVIYGEVHLDLSFGLDGQLVAVLYHRRFQLCRIKGDY